MKAIMTVLCMFILVSVYGASTMINFDDTSDLSTYFNQIPSNQMSNIADNGINNTGCIDLYQDGSEVATVKNSGDVPLIGTSISVSGYFYNTGLDGFAILGFSSLATNSLNETFGGEVEAIGGSNISVAVHGGGAFVHNNGSHVSDFDWYGESGDLNMGWYKITCNITRNSAAQYHMLLDIWQSDTAGNLVSQFTSQQCDIDNFSLGTEPSIHALFGSSYSRMQYIDNFSYTYDESVLPVVLSSFNATMSESSHSVLLKWTVESEINHVGYKVFRGIDNNLSAASCMSNNMITEGNQGQYQYSDTAFEYGNTYYYWLASYGLDGNVEFYGPTSITLGANPGTGTTTPIPAATALNQAYPNPFKPNTTISYSLRQGENVTISVYNCRGQLVRNSTINHANPGNYTFQFDGKDNAGKQLSAGLYLYKMTTPTFKAVRKFTILK